MRFNPAYAASIGAIAALCVGVAAFAAMEPRPAPARSHGAALQIALVAPKEPEVGAGSVMDVGELADGYEHRPYAPVSHTPSETWADGDYAEELPSPPRARWAPAAEEMRAAAVEFVEEVRERPLSFGFDRPRPDYAEERRQRREAMERREMERRAFERRDMERRDHAAREFARRERERRFEEAAYDARRAATTGWRYTDRDRGPPPPPVEETFY